MGGLSAGGAIVTGTGAFTSVEADRDVAVDVAGDANAYLALQGVGPNKDYLLTDNGTIGLNLTGSNTNISGSGVNANAITVIEGFSKCKIRAHRKSKSK
jgi:Protein of unknown function (DUF1102).